MARKISRVPLPVADNIHITEDSHRKRVEENFGLFSGRYALFPENIPPGLKVISSVEALGLAPEVLKTKKYVAFYYREYGRFPQFPEREN